MLNSSITNQTWYITIFTQWLCTIVTAAHSRIKPRILYSAFELTAKMAFEGIIASTIGFAPAVIVCYFFTKDFFELCEEGEIVRLFGLGMVFGFFVALIYGSLGVYLVALDWSIIIYVIAIPLMTTLGFFVMLHSRRRVGKKSTAIHAPMLGAGFSSMSTTYIVYREILISAASIDLLTYLSMVAVFLALSLANSAAYVSVSTIQGIGSYSGYFREHYLKSLLVLSTYSIILLPYMWRVKYSILYLGFAVAYSYTALYLTKRIYKLYISR